MWLLTFLSIDILEQKKFFQYILYFCSRESPFFLPVLIQSSSSWRSFSRFRLWIHEYFPFIPRNWSHAIAYEWILHETVFSVAYMVKLLVPVGHYLIHLIGGPFPWTNITYYSSILTWLSVHVGRCLLSSLNGIDRCSSNLRWPLIWFVYHSIRSGSCFGNQLSVMSTQLANCRCLLIYSRSKKLC